MKKTSILLTVMAAIFSMAAYGQAPGRPAITPEYTPVHDPVVAFCDGRYYMFSTGMGICVMSSDDMKNWSFEKQVLDPIPEWAVKAVPGYNGHTWAPDIIYHNGLWYLYYSCSTFASNGSCIGVATNKTLNPESPDFKWTDHGMIIQSVPNRDKWNAIDPNIIIDEEGTPWMAFGSFWDGLKITRLDESMLKLSDPQEWHPLWHRPELMSGKMDLKSEPGDGAVEAPFIFRHDGWYYLFASLDLCCRGENSNYKVAVARSKSVTGPYLDRDGKLATNGGGTIVAQSNDRYVGVGHCAVVTFDGKDYIFMHGYDKTRRYNSMLITRQIVWDKDGWPIINL